MRFLLLAALVLACSDRVPDPKTAPTNDTTPTDPADCALPTTPFALDAEPTAPMAPVPGELFIVQRRLPLGTSLEPGESAIIVGPDGTVVLLDVGNGHHDDDVRDALRELNTTWLVPARGYSARTPLQVEWVILTHFHADHIGAFGPLVEGDEPLDIRKGLIHRGFVDLGQAASEGDLPAVCHFLRAHPKLDVATCVADAPAPCDAISAHFPALSCPGLHLGNLEDPTDDAAGAPTFLPLGNCAKLTILASNAHVTTTSGEQVVGGIGWDDTNEENARSLVGFVEHGPFRYHFGGDLTGAGSSGIPDVESPYSLAAREKLGALGADVIHAHHHARKTSSNEAIVAALAPLDGKSRNVVAGINAGYVGSPQTEVLDAWLNGNRLNEGRFWVTATAGRGAREGLVEADGHVALRTFLRGRGYRLQAVGDVTTTKAFPAVRER